MKIDTDQLIVEDGGIISTATLAEDGGKGGDIEINADDFVNVTGTAENQLFGSSISVDTANSNTAGNLILTTDQLFVQNGAGISASTFGEGQGGTLTINASDILLKGTSQDGEVSSGIYAQSFAEGTGGNINISADGDLNLQNEARIVVSNDARAEDAGNLLEKTRNLIDALRGIPGLPVLLPTVIERRPGTGDAGKIEISANTISLHNQAAILGETASGEGGNIDLDIWDLLLLRLSSEISTTAGTAQAGGNGGNIIIDAPNGFVFGVSTENSDIAANAFTGDGGSVTINAQDIYGLEFRPARTPLSDITASSEAGGSPGTVNLDTLGIDPSSGLVTLPDEPRNPEVTDSCQISTGADTVEFFDIGRGGSPADPDSILNIEAGLDVWIPLHTQNDQVRNIEHEISHPVLAHNTVPRFMSDDFTQEISAVHQSSLACQSSHRFRPFRRL